MQTEDDRLAVVLCWHMHQPEYRDTATGHYALPWTLLHATKDYVDMAAHLEAEPGARAVVNFSPVLLEQIADCTTRLGAYLAGDTAPLPDPLLAALAGELPASAEARRVLIAQCLRANTSRVIARFPAWERRCELVRRIGTEHADLDFLSDAFVRDLACWYLIGWIGETVRRTDTRVQHLQEHADGFDAEDRQAMLRIVHGLLAGLLPRYRALADADRIELAMSPWGHPILPLLQDPHAGLEAQPQGLRQSLDHYPDGDGRARWHLRRGREVFRQCFGREPAGCWPSEGAISTRTLRLLGEEGFAWCASGEGVLRNSVRLGGMDASDAGIEACMHRVYRLHDTAVNVFFRDDGLSDLIGFRYADWHADDAVANLLHHMDNIAAACPDRRNCAISVILDGENAWEYYPENAFHFLGALYRGLAHHPRLVPETFSGFLARRSPEARVLPTVVAGSWVYGTLSTWVGSADKNRGWERLVEAKQAFDRAVAGGRLTGDALAAAERQLAVCEGSDWFWWFGDENPAASVSDFDRLFRHHLATLWRLCGEAPPANLAEPLSAGRGDPARGGVMRPGSEHP